MQEVKKDCEWALKKKQELQDNVAANIISGEITALLANTPTKKMEILPTHIKNTKMVEYHSSDSEDSYCPHCERKITFKPKTLLEHIEEVSKEVRETWPKWKQVIFMPRKPRNEFKT